MGIAYAIENVDRGHRRPDSCECRLDQSQAQPLWAIVAGDFDSRSYKRPIGL